VPPFWRKVKNKLKYLLQSLLGFSRYLYIFSNFKIATLHWDKKEADFFYFLSLMKKENGAILDVGANIGIMTAHLSEKFPNNEIFSIEPMPENLEVLKEIIRKRGMKNVIVFPVAVGSQSGVLKMIMPTDGKAKLQGLSHVKTAEITEWNEGEEFDVEVKTLDELFANEKVQGIKMDVENYEFHALKGSIAILQNQRPIVYTELWDNENRNKCMELMISLNYKIQVVVNKELTDFDPAVHKNQNFLFIPN
jgi:FkbM family methyltransferase